MSKRIVLHGVGAEVILMCNITKPATLPFGTRAIVSAVRYYEDHTVSPICIYDLIVDDLMVDGVAAEFLFEPDDDLGVIIEEITRWSKAYPLEQFPEPDFNKVREVLEGNGLSLGEVSASIMRHVLTKLIEMVHEGENE